jgi:hypothetical protein
MENPSHEEVKEFECLPEIRLDVAEMTRASRLLGDTVSAALNHTCPPVQYPCHGWPWKGQLRKFVVRSTSHSGRQSMAPRFVGHF